MLSVSANRCRSFFPFRESREHPVLNSAKMMMMAVNVFLGFFIIARHVT